MGGPVESRRGDRALTRTELRTWVIVSAVLVIFMQAGFLFLEIGFSRGKNAGSGVAKILVNFSDRDDRLVGLRVRAGLRRRGTIFGDSGFFLRFGSEIADGSLVAGPFGGASSAFFIFQFAFCAVSLAIVWGTTLERLKFAAYAIFAVVFAGLHLPADRALGLRRRAVRRHRLGRAGLRRLLGRAPHRRHRGAGGADPARPAPRQVRPGRALARDPGALDADLRARRADPLGGLVRVQRGLDAGNQRRSASPRSRS